MDFQIFSASTLKQKDLTVSALIFEAIPNDAFGSRQYNSAQNFCFEPVQT